MPQIHLEYSFNCRPDKTFETLFKEVHQTLTSVGGIRIDNCKSRATCHQDFYIADGNPRHGFAHLSIRFVEGRTETIKNKIGIECLAHLKWFFKEQLQSLELQLTVEIQDIRLSDYHKFPEGTLTKQR